MLSSILHYRTAWNDYFPGTNPTTTLVPKEYTSTQTPSDTYVYVSNSLFKQCSSSNNGGALSCSSSVTYLLVESSSFFSCKTSSSYSGAIYFYNTNSGECVLNKLCGNDCCSTVSSSFGQFARIYVKNAVSNKNYVDYSSITRCVNENSNSCQTLLLYYGKIFCPSVNLSMNKCYYRSAISCNPFSDSSSAICSLSYSSFADNSASGYNCIHFNNDGAKYEMKSCNIIRNTQVDLNSEGTIRLWGNMLIEDSCILENTATYTFNPAGTSYIFTLSNCTVDKTTISAGSLIIRNTITKSFIHALNHMSTQNCHAEYDSAGTLNPKKQRIYYSCQTRLRDIISTMWVFVFNFVHPYDRCSQRIINVQVL
jgi:hypothetical protein